MLRLRIALASALLVPLALSSQEPAVTDWIRANAVRLNTVEAGHGFADMEPLRKIIGDARIVSLGEATHGTREFFQLKHRMLEFLATQMGFTIFSIEANMPEAYRLNGYVLNGTGDPAQLLRGMYFWTWNTEEVLDMIHWMRDFNASGRGRVQFTGFDMQTTPVAAEIVRAYVARTDPAYEATVRDAVKLATGPVATIAGPAFGVLVGTFPWATVAGKTIRLSGYIKTDAIDSGYAGLWWRADSRERSAIAFNNMQEMGPRGTTDWQRYEFELQIPADVNNINFGALHPGYGTAWFSDLVVEIDGKKYEDPAFDFSLGASRPRGFGASGAGYEIRLDSAVPHNGHATFRMGRSHSMNAAPAQPTAAAVVAAWRAIYDKLRTSSDTSWSARWAVQNARVVMQAMELRTGTVSRDQSMAENIKWILDENPKAKIVLWAHNGHVAAAGAGGIARSMGAYLREEYGTQMVVLGFAFNRGSFQAIGRENGRTTTLRQHTVGPADSSSFDRALGAAGVPVFALDLRKPPQGAVSAWLDAAHGTRWIGAVFSADEPRMFMASVVPRKVFDAVLFVDSTTAARGLPMR
jgi:erythromycin esterase-like protein